MSKARVTFSYRAAPTRLQSSACGSHLSTSNDRSVDGGEETAPLHSPEQGIPVGPAVAGYVPGGLEWGVDVR